MYSPYYAALLDAQGNSLAGKSVNVEVKYRDEGGAIASGIFADEDGAETLDNPFVTTTGQILMFSEGGLYHVRAYIGPSEAPTTEIKLPYQQIGLGAQTDITGLDAAGTYGGGTIYAKNALVTSAEGRLFVSLHAGNQGNTPPDADESDAHWQWVPAPQGGKGPTGAAGPVMLDYVFSTATSGDPGAGKCLFDNAVPGSMTAFHVSKTDRNGNPRGPLLELLDNSSSTVKLTGLVTDTADGSKTVSFAAATAFSDQGGFYTLAITGAAGTIPDDAAISSLFIVPTGDAGGGLSALVNDTTPQLGGQLDVNGNAIGDGALELLKFIETVAAVNEISVKNAATGNGPELRATGDDTNIDLKLVPKGTGATEVNALQVVGGKGGTSSVFDRGTISTGTETPGPSDGYLQKAVNNGAHTLAATSETGAFRLVYTNGASAGAITASGFDKVIDSDTGLSHTVLNSIVEVVVVNDGVAKVATVTLLVDAT